MTADELNKEVEKIIKLVFPTELCDNWDETIIDYLNVLESQYLKLIEPLIIKEKDKLIYSVASRNYFIKLLFFDIDYNFNDTLNNLKTVTIQLINLLNDENNGND